MILFSVMFSMFLFSASSLFVHTLLYMHLFLCLLVPPLFCCVLLPAGGGQKNDCIFACLQYISYLCQCDRELLALSL